MGKRKPRSKGQKRQHIKQRWGEAKINMGKGPKPEAVAEYANRMRSIKHPIPPTKSIDPALWEKSFSDSELPPRELVRRFRQTLIEGEKVVPRMQQLWSSTFNRVCLNRSPWREIWMMFSGQVFVFVRVIKPTGEMSRSDEYIGKDRAMAYYKSDTVFYHPRERFKIPDTPV